jgi:hypothetical protein
MNPVGHMASKAEHAVAGFGQTTSNYVANHAQEIGLSAGAAAVVGDWQPVALRRSLVWGPSRPCSEQFGGVTSPVTFGVVHPPRTSR